MKPAIRYTLASTLACVFIFLYGNALISSNQGSGLTIWIYPVAALAAAFALIANDWHNRLAAVWVALGVVGGIMLSWLPVWVLQALFVAGSEHTRLLVQGCIFGAVGGGLVALSLNKLLRRH